MAKCYLVDSGGAGVALFNFNLNLTTKLLQIDQH